ncbi:MAG: hypothetical protein KDC44_02325 [Phaeodactylibacter sp.]|nr:hypothetical protein [Phaeodactylibacter sp.]
MSSFNRLTQLIERMSAPEKGYFKKMAQAFHQQNLPAYVQLFDELESGQALDEDALRQKYAEGKSYSYWATLKGYLYDQLLKALRSYEEGQSQFNKALQWKREADLLINRNLYEDGLQRLQKAKKLAYQLEYFSLLLDLLAMENQVTGYYMIQDYVNAKDAIYKETQHVLTLLEQERFYSFVYDMLFAYSKKEHVFRTPKELEVLQHWMEDPRLQDESLPHTYQSKICFYGSHYTWQVLQGKDEAAFSYSEKVLAVWAEYPQQRKEKFSGYLATVVNHVNRCFLLKKEAEISHWLAQMSKMKTSDPSLQKMLEIRLALFLVEYFQLTLDFKDMDRQVESIREMIKRLPEGGMVVEQRLLLYNLSLLHWVTGQGDRALEFCIEANQLPSSEAQTVLQRFARLLEVLLHFDLEHERFLEHALRNLYQYLKNQEKLYRFERLCIQMVRELKDKRHTYGSKSIYQKYLSEFEALRRDDYEKRAFVYLDIITWLRAQLQRCTMAEIYQADKQASTT